MSKLTRRGLLGMLGIGTGAVAVLPAIAKAIAETPEIVPNFVPNDADGRAPMVTMCGSWSPSAYGADEYNDDLNDDFDEDDV